MLTVGKSTDGGLGSVICPEYSSASLRTPCESNTSRASKTECLARENGQVISNKSSGGSIKERYVDDSNHLAIVETLLEYLLLLESAQGSPRGTHDDLSHISDVTTSLYYYLNDEVPSSFVEKLIDRAKMRGEKCSILLRYRLYNSLYKIQNPTSSLLTHQLLFALKGFW